MIGNVVAIIVFFVVPVTMWIGGGWYWITELGDRDDIAARAFHSLIINGPVVWVVATVWLACYATQHNRYLRWYVNLKRVWDMI